MLKTTLAVAAFLGILSTTAFGQTAKPLTDYVDANGFLDVQTLTCAQLAGTYQEDADALTSWYSGWYNGLAHKHFLDFKKGREVEHQVIVYCKANPEKKIIEAMAIIFKDDRIKLGIELK
jgi:HdeA/HdeB family